MCVLCVCVLCVCVCVFFFNDTATTEIYTLSLHDALPICLTPLIGKRGGIAGDFTITRTGEESFLIIGSGMAERYHQRFWKEVPLPEGTSFESVTDKNCEIGRAHV